MTQENSVTHMTHVLSDSYALYLKTQNYHWNVEGPHFTSLHTLFEEQYTDLAAAIDEIAELIRGLGAKTPGTFDEYQNLTTIENGDQDADALTMVQHLTDDQDKILKTLQAAVKVAQELDDDVIADALIARMTVHRKNKWMLTSILK